MKPFLKLIRKIVRQNQTIHTKYVLIMFSALNTVEESWMIEEEEELFDIKTLVFIG